MSEQTTTSPSLLLNPGTVLDGRYEVLGKLGEGGFAMVYRARQINIQRDVAIKVLSSSGVDSRTAKQFEERFLREARTAARINHPNVVNIFDFGFTDQLRQPFIAMEMLTGHDLEEELQTSGAMDVERAVPLFLEALEALGEAHKQGIIHKDLKPSNLFLCHPGSRRELIKVVDFGIARINESKGKRLTGTGQILGTPQYLAPEYIQAQIATPALDVYQMGLILVELLTGKAVVDFDNPYQCLMAHGSGTLEVPASLINGALGAVILRALEHDHNARFRNADDFYHALKAVDLAAVERIDPGGVRHKISEVSGSLRQVAYSGITSTGQFHSPSAGGARQRVPAEGGGALGSAETMAVELDSGANNDSVDRSATVVSAGAHADAAPVNSQPMPAESKRSSRPSNLLLGAVLVALFLVTVLVAGAVMVTMKSDGPGSRGRAKVASSKTKVGTKTKARLEDALRGGAATPAPKEMTPTDDAEPVKAPAAVQGGDDKAPTPVVEAVEVAIVPTPVGAEVFVNGESVGKGRVTHRFEEGKDDEPVAVKVVAQGFVQQELKLSPGQGPEVAVELKRKQPPRAQTQRQPPKSKATPPKPKDTPPKDPPAKRPSMGFVE